MQSGLFLIMARAGDDSVRDALTAAVDDAVLAEELGFDRVWVTEHHGTDFGTCTSPSVVAAAIAARTRAIGIGYAINVTPFHAPRRLAEDIAAVDHLSAGRVWAGFGSGYSPVEYARMGVDFDRRAAVSRDSTREVVRLWRSGEVPAFRSPHPPVVVACRTLAAIRGVARAGHGVLLLGQAQRLERGLRTYREVAGDGGYVGVLRHILIHGRDRDATAAVRAATRWTLQAMADLTGHDGAVADTRIDDYLRERAFLGSAARVRDQVRTLTDLGVTELLCWVRWGGLPDDLVRDSMRRYRDRVA